MIYFLGFILVLVACWGWNGFIEADEDFTDIQKDKAKITLGNALLASFASWGTIIILIVAIIVGSILYFMTESETVKSLDAFFQRKN